MKNERPKGAGEGVFDNARALESGEEELCGWIICKRSFVLGAGKYPTTQVRDGRVS